MHFSDQFCNIYIAYYHMLLCDSIYFGKRIQPQIIFSLVSWTNSEMYFFTSNNSYKISLNAIPFFASHCAALFFLSFSFIYCRLFCLSCFSFLIQYAFALLVLSPYHHPFFVTYFPHICLSSSLFFVDEAAVRSRHHAQALFFCISCELMRQATNFKRAQLAPYTVGLCTMSSLELWVFHSSRYFFCLSAYYAPPPPSILCFMSLFLNKFSI